VLTVSRVQNGVSGFRDVAMSLPTVVGVEGAVHVIEPEMSLDEREQLEHSAAVLRAASGQTRSSRDMDSLAQNKMAAIVNQTPGTCSPPG
jgi:malate/lactate dehydrogenase